MYLEGNDKWGYRNKNVNTYNTQQVTLRKISLTSPACSQ